MKGIGDDADWKSIIGLISYVIEHELDSSSRSQFGKKNEHGKECGAPINSTESIGAFVLEMCPSSRRTHVTKEEGRKFEDGEMNLH